MEILGLLAVGGWIAWFWLRTQRNWNRFTGVNRFFEGYCEDPRNPSELELAKVGTMCWTEQETRDAVERIARGAGRHATQIFLRGPMGGPFKLEEGGWGESDALARRQWTAMGRLAQIAAGFQRAGTEGFAEIEEACRSMLAEEARRTVPTSAERK